MSNKTDIQNKLVDFNVVTSPTQIAISEPKDHGKLTVVIPGDDKNAIYVGDSHIASGYGFDAPSTKYDIIDLLQNPNVQSLIRGEYTVNPDTGGNQNQGGDQTVVIPNSSVTFNNATLSFGNGVLSASTWITVSNVEIVLSNGDRLYVDNEYEYSMLSNPLRITRINFYYDIKSEANTTILKYFVDFSLKELSNGITLSGGTDYTFTSTGVKTYASITTNITLPRESNQLTYEHPVNLIINDGTRTTFIHICTIKYKYPVFATAEPSLSNIDINDTSDLRIGYYDEIHGVDLTIPNATDEAYNYIWVPSILSDKKFAIIYKPSSVGCNFKLDGRAIRIEEVLSGVSRNESYDRYKSPWAYFGEMIWTIK